MLLCHGALEESAISISVSSGMCNIMGCFVVRVMGLDGAQAPVLVWVDVFHPLSPVSVAPEIQPGPEEVKVLANGSVVLPCQAEGWPMPQVTWRKDGRLLPLRGNNRYKGLVASRAGARIVPPSTSRGVLACPHWLSGYVPHLAAMVLATFLAMCPCVLHPGHAELPQGSPAVPSQAAAPARRLPANRPCSGPGFGLLPLHGIQPRWL